MNQVHTVNTASSKGAVEVAFFTVYMVQVKSPDILWMEEILHHLGCTVQNLESIGIFTISIGAGFLPSTVLRNHFVTSKRSLPPVPCHMSHVNITHQQRH